MAVTRDEMEDIWELNSPSWRCMSASIVVIDSNDGGTVAEAKLSPALDPGISDTRSSVSKGANGRQQPNLRSSFEPFNATTITPTLITRSRML